MNRNKLKTIILITIAVIVFALLLFCLIYSVSRRTNEDNIKQQVIQYVRENNEDNGDYIILVQEATEDSLDKYRYFFVWMCDEDDTELTVVRYDNNSIEGFDIWCE